MEGRTKFSKWLIDKGYTSKGFARLMAEALGQQTFSRATVDEWRSGKRVPHLRAMVAIEKASGGELTPQHFLEPRP